MAKKRLQYAYDAVGNRSLLVDHDGRQFAFANSNNMLSSTTRNTATGGFDAEYKYDALGRRVAKTVDDAVAMTTTTTVYVCRTQPIPYSPWAGQVLAEYTSGTAATSPLRKYAYGEYIDEPLAMIDRTALGSTGAGTDETFYYHKNQQYSIVALSDSGGSISERYHYTPYGETTITDAAGTTTRTTSDIGNSYTYTGRRLDGESNLSFFRARYLHSTTGRFISRDPRSYRAGSNHYSLVRSRVLSKVDPLGLQDTSPPVGVLPVIDPPLPPPNPDIGSLPPTRIEPGPGGLGDNLSPCQAAMLDIAGGSHAVNQTPYGEKAFECNVNIFCGNCGKNGAGKPLSGRTYTSGGRVHICVNASTTAPQERIEALILHEMVHASQMIEADESLCNDKCHVGGNPLPKGDLGRPRIPPEQLDPLCEEVKAAEKEAYAAQAAYLFPGAEDKQAAFVEAGVCFSSRHVCREFDGRPCPPFPK